MNESRLSKSKALGSKLMYATLQVLKDKGGELVGREVVNEVGRRIELDDWAREIYEKSGKIRWQSLLHFYTIDCIKAGFMVKRSGIWYITSEGEEALELGKIGLLDAAVEAYRKWEVEKQEVESEEIDDEGEQGITLQTFDEIEQLAIDGLEEHIRLKNPYEFQELVAALLRGMKYYTPFVAPRGKDGGIDVIAYRDPLGTVSPRIKVQVKHRPNTSATVQEIRQLMGLLQTDGDVGIFISTGGFTTDAKNTARSSQVHVELVDLSRFTSLWQEFYHEMTDEDKNWLPLHPVYFLAQPN